MLQGHEKRVFYAKKIHTTQLVWISYIFLVFTIPNSHDLSPYGYYIECSNQQE